MCVCDFLCVFCVLMNEGRLLELKARWLGVLVVWVMVYKACSESF